MPSHRKGWRVRVLQDISRGVWWLAPVFDDKKAVGWRHGNAPKRRTSAHQLTERAARRALADAKRDGREAQLINPEGVIVKWVNKP